MAVGALLALAIGGCGAKTGLYADDAETNSESDAGLPDLPAEMEVIDPERPCV
ncbi:MAG: hypothetical protein AAF645_28025 [Myxococcota bacterium]